MWAFPCPDVGLSVHLSGNMSQNKTDRAPAGRDDVFFVGDVARYDPAARPGSVLHVLCTAGSMSFTFLDVRYEVRAADYVILPNVLFASAFAVGEGFRGLVMDLSTSFVNALNLGGNYGVTGQLSLLRNPVMHLAPADFARCLDGLERIRLRLGETAHSFRSEAVAHLLMAHILDLYDVHLRTHAPMRLSGHTALLLHRFITLLYAGAYRRHRDPAYYAARLCVTPHYLSEVCRKVGGRPASYWIDLFTTQEACRRLAQRGRTIASIAADLHFSSPAHFSAYVTKHLGLSPARYRAGLTRR